MHITFPDKMEKVLKYLKLKLLPNTLFFRTMLLIFIPLILVQAVSVIAFFNGNWEKVGKRLSNNLSSNIATAIEVVSNAPDRLTEMQELYEKNYGLSFELITGEAQLAVKTNTHYGKDYKIVTGFLEQSLHQKFPDAITSVYLENGRDNIIVLVETSQGLYRFKTLTKNIFSTSIFGFVAWMVGTSLLLFLVATLFLRIQVRSIATLAQVAEDFGKGINTPFKPYGSSEVRKAGIAFIKMKERIQKQISERTQMLAGVSHDLRTPLTRMKLQLAMLPDNPDNKEFIDDIGEMEKMLDGYLAFVSGEGGEKNTFVDMNELILSIINKFRNTKAMIRYSTNDQVSAIQGREQALKRAVTNIISNAFNYGKTIAVALESNNNKLEITVDDDGPGIPADKREEVFKAFYRIDESRNKETGGVGLGLSIARDIITSHGGKIELTDSALGGLRVLISIPL
ncbi:MAG: two-component sensor histidine kinase [Alphaproteobacteria bacterium]|nr:two-component sensor histidine kinase [Alphaproteobacteria bacterium]